MSKSLKPVAPAAKAKFVTTPRPPTVFVSEPKPMTISISPPAAPPSFSPPPSASPAPTNPGPVRIELPPDLPMSSFTSTEVWQPQRIGALAVYCSDGRWGDAFDEFCHRSLNIPRYDRFAVPGGPAWLANLDSQHPELQKAAHDQIEFLVRVHELERVVLITHWGCAFYHKPGKENAPRDTLPDQLKDVRAAAKALNATFPKIQIESYVAMRDEGRMSFHRLTK